MNNTKPCGNCGYPLDETEQSTMHEFKGKMFSNDLNDNIQSIQHDAIEKYGAYLVNLFDGENPVIEVFFENPDNAFICAVVGAITVEHLEKIEHEVYDVAESGDGIYVFKCLHNSAIYIDGGFSEGEYWELEELSYEALED